ncbi:MAG: tetratricopeptide repeat protein, partial [Chlorobi bacterium]|nr:tetratricopeptide repeat protein [Chlorobiota bacterium]
MEPPATHNPPPSYPIPVFHSRHAEALAGVFRQPGMLDETSLARVAAVREFARSRGDQLSLAESHRCAGLIHSRNGKLTAAATEFQKAVELLEPLENQAPLTHALRELGVTLMNLGSYDSALKLLLRALELRQQHGGEDPLRIYNDLGVIHHKMHEYERALQFYNLARAEAERGGESQRVAGVLANIAAIYSRLERYDEALATHQQALAIRQTLHDQLGVAQSLGNMGVLYALQGEGATALSYYMQSLELRQELGEKLGTATILRNIGSVHRGNGDYQLALEYCNRAIQIAQEAEAGDLLYQFHQEIALVYEAMEDYQNALEHHKKFVEYYSATLSSEKRKSVAELQAKYDLERANAEREQFRRRMLEWEHTAFRAQVNPHFLFNALNSIQYFLVGHDTESANRYLSRFARLMRMALENSRTALISLKSELECIELYMNLEQLRFGERLRYRVEVEDEIEEEEL